MPPRTTAAKRYAEAIGAIARQTSAWSRWRADLDAVASALHENPPLRLTLESPRVAAARKEQMLDQALGGRIATETRNLLGLLARRGRLELLPDIATWFGEMADRSLGIQHVTVTSAVPLDDQARAVLRDRLRQGGEVMLDEQVDPSILGGLVIRQGDIIRDYSVRARLELLRERLN